MSGTVYSVTSTGTGGICSRGAKQRLTEWIAAGLVAASLLVPLGCAHHRASAPTDTGSDIVLVVENHHWNDVVVSVLHDGVVDRIGLVTAVKTSTLVIPSRRLGSSGVIRLRGHAVGAPDDHTSDSFVVRPGQEVQWTLESDLARSSVSVH